MKPGSLLALAFAALFLNLAGAPVLAKPPAVGASATDTQSDTWAATDALNRELPTHAQTGSPRPDKWVGVFYFLWLGEHGQDGPYDISTILTRDPDAASKPNSPLWGPIGAPHHWGQSVFGYYRSSDEWVLRKHAQMLSDAGVDVVIFDTTNNLTYPRSYLALCRVWTQIRREGGKTPQIAFLAPFGDPSQVVQTLYQDFYEPGLFRPLWFQWEGKPLLLADPKAVRADTVVRSQRVPGLLQAGETVGQSFHATRPFTSVGGAFPTYQATTSWVTVSLFKGAKPGGLLLYRKAFANLTDNGVALLELDAPLPPGDYYLEQSNPVGQVGWWSETGASLASGRAWANRQPTAGMRQLSVRWQGETTLSPLSSDDARLSPEAAARRAETIGSFFTFRKGQPDYFSGPTGPNQWGWLDVFPQKPYAKKPNGPPEEVTVGVAQNAVDGKLSVLSNPQAQGRSFHNGKQPDTEHQDTMGRNFAEQWERALTLDPQFIFITGWNEWVAGRFDRNAPFFAPTPVSFVDEFNEEYSRDIEPSARPSRSGDNYYYQMVAGIRRFKGVRPDSAPAAPITPPLAKNGRWNGGKTYKDDVFDTTHRNEKGWSTAVGENGLYRNTTGRNDFVHLQTAHDARFVYFRAQTREPIRAINTPGAMQLFVALRTGGAKNAPTWEGFAFAINRNGKKHGAFVTVEKRSLNGKWQIVGKAHCDIVGATMAVTVPRALLGLTDQAAPVNLDFKWMDNVHAETDMLNLYRNGDAAPNGRFRFRYFGLPTTAGHKKRPTQ